LKDVLDRVRFGEIHGLNVTIPHKQNIVPLMDELTLTAQAIGAVNTIYVRENNLIGDNTDAQGFLTDLKNFIRIHRTEIRNRKSAIVLGAGGSARAVVYALLNDGWTVTIAARRIEKAQQLASSMMNSKLQITNYSNPQPPTFDLLVNTTPIGMAPNPDQSPWPDNLPFPSHAAVYDLVYNPSETKLVKDARSQGLHATTGLGMLIEQAALAFEIWTGQSPSREMMRLSILESDKSHEFRR
jgi:shikimate dehydrogenase